MSFRHFLFLSLLLSISACAPSVVRYYEGPERASNKVAVLYHNTERGIKIFTIDDKSVQNRITTFNPDGWDEVHLEPGQHTLSGELYIENKHAIFSQRYQFEAGKKYRLMYEIDDIGSKARFYLQQVE